VQKQEDIIVLWFKPELKKYVLDTSILVDGRLMVMYRNDLLEGRIVVPTFVLRELQTLADSKNYVNEKKGKKGFKSVSELKAAVEKTGAEDRFMTWDRTTLDKIPEVDDKLIAFCKEEKAILVTVDGNLTQVAKLQDLKVLNPNVLVNQLRRTVSVGEKYVLKLSEAGKQAGQAIGYLPDGTLVVVDHGDRYINQVVSVLVRNVIVTDTGLIVFADITWDKR